MRTIMLLADRANAYVATQGAVGDCANNPAAAAELQEVSTVA